MTTVHVYGASGYAGLEAIRLVQAHPELQLGVLESSSHAGELVGSQAPLLRGIGRMFAGEGSVRDRAAAGDVVILAGGHGRAQMVAPALLAGNIRVVDLSEDYRFDKRAAYGFPHLFREQIAAADLVANPGCYPTATLLATLPLAGMPVREIVVDAKSGITGAGRSPSTAALFAEVSGDVRAYGLTGHRHEREIETYWRAAGIAAQLCFTPHVVPLARGMLVDAYATFENAPDPMEIAEAYARTYADDPFTELLETAHAPSLPALIGTNRAEIHVSVKGRVVRALCAIDNLGRGASAQAIQNINIMLGYPEETGLARTAIAC